MVSNHVYPYKSSYPTLDWLVDDRYVYHSAADPRNILASIIRSEELSDINVKKLRDKSLAENSQLAQEDSYFVLREGILIDNDHGLGNLLIAIEYNFAQNKPRIVVPGKLLPRSRKERRAIRDNGIRLTPLRNGALETFVSKYLRKTDWKNNDHVYTGEAAGIVYTQKPDRNL